MTPVTDVALETEPMAEDAPVVTMLPPNAPDASEYAVGPVCDELFRAERGGLAKVLVRDMFVNVGSKIVCVDVMFTLPVVDEE